MPARKRIAKKPAAKKTAAKKIARNALRAARDGGEA